MFKCNANMSPTFWYQCKSIIVHYLMLRDINIFLYIFRFVFPLTKTKTTPSSCASNLPQQNSLKLVKFEIPDYLIKEYTRLQI